LYCTLIISIELTAFAVRTKLSTVLLRLSGAEGATVKTLFLGPFRRKRCSSHPSQDENRYRWRCGVSITTRLWRSLRHCSPTQRSSSVTSGVLTSRQHRAFVCFNPC